MSGQGNVEHHKPPVQFCCGQNLSLSCHKTKKISFLEYIHLQKKKTGIFLYGYIDTGDGTGKGEGRDHQTVYDMGI